MTVFFICLNYILNNNMKQTENVRAYFILLFIYLYTDKVHNMYI